MKDEDVELIDLRDAATMFDNVTFTALSNFFEKDAEQLDAFYTRPLKVYLSINGVPLKFSQVIKHIGDQVEELIKNRAGELVRSELYPLFMKANAIARAAEEADQELKREIRKALPGVTFDDDDND